MGSAMHPAVHELGYASERLIVGSPRGVAHVGAEKREHTLRNHRPGENGIDEDVGIARLGANPSGPEVLLSHFEELPPEAVLVDEELRLEVVAVGCGGMSLDGHGKCALAFD